MLEGQPKFFVNSRFTTISSPGMTILNSSFIIRQLAETKKVWIPGCQFRTLLPGPINQSSKCCDFVWFALLIYLKPLQLGSPARRWRQNYWKLWLTGWNCSSHWWIICKNALRHCRRQCGARPRCTSSICICRPIFLISCLLEKKRKAVKLCLKNFFSRSLESWK